MIDKVSVSFTMLAFIIVSASYFIYDNYDNGIELHPIKQLDKPNSNTSNRNILEFEATLAELIFRAKAEEPLRDKLFDLGTLIDRIPFSIDQLNENAWGRILTIIKNSFPQLDTRELITVLSCYGRYRFTLQKLENSTERQLSNETIFAHRDTFFGRTWSQILFATEFNMYANQLNQPMLLSLPIGNAVCVLDK